MTHKDHIFPGWSYLESFLSQAQWYAPRVPAIQEVDAKVSLEPKNYRVSLDNSVAPISIKKEKREKLLTPA